MTSEIKKVSSISSTHYKIGKKFNIKLFFNDILQCAC